MDSDKHRNASKIHIRLSHVHPRIVENVVSHLSRWGYRGAADNFQYSRFFLLGMDSDKHRNANKIHIRLSHVDPRLVENVVHICRGCGGQFSVFQIFRPRDACLRLWCSSTRNLLVHELHATVRLQSDHSPIYSQITVRSQSDHMFYQQLEIFREKKDLSNL